jgi:hypothetical protein
MLTKVERGKEVKKVSTKPVTLLVRGAATITLDQSMRSTRRKLARGSIAEDWRAIGDDLRCAMRDGRGEQAFG